MKKDCNCSPNGSATCGGDVKTPFGLSGNLSDYNPAIDQPLQAVEDDFGYGATSEFVPTGVVMGKMSDLLIALDWHIYATKTITLEEARQKIKWAAELMDKKFDLEYQRLPR
jgi:hypothetical protein